MRGSFDSPIRLHYSEIDSDDLFKVFDNPHAVSHPIPQGEGTKFTGRVPLLVGSDPFFSEQGSFRMLDCHRLEWATDRTMTDEYSKSAGGQCREDHCGIYSLAIFVLLLG